MGSQKESISASVMIPEHRLVQLLDQIKQSQVSRCLYHNPSAPLSLFMDHICDRNEFPLQTIKELGETPGEIWNVRFSHNGKYLAISGSGKIATIFDTATWETRHRLSDHGDHVFYITWSPDDTKLITCCKDHKARIWDTHVSDLEDLVRISLTLSIDRSDPCNCRPSCRTCYHRRLGSRWPIICYRLS